MNSRFRPGDLAFLAVPKAGLERGSLVAITKLIGPEQYECVHEECSRFDDARIAFEVSDSELWTKAQRFQMREVKA